MTLPSELALQKLQFYVTTPYKCGYLPKKMAQSLIATPQNLVNTQVYNGLIQQGFRRSGKFAYRPHCETCHACVSVRLKLQDFTPNRSQKRAFKQHANLTVRIMPLHFNFAHFTLYQAYQAARHNEEELAINPKSNDEISQYRQFLCQSNVESVMLEFTDAQNQLKIVSIVDLVSDGVSAVYTFYDTKEMNTGEMKSGAPKSSYGTYSIMWQAQWAKSLALPYLYLGYLISESKKMVYKQSFKPLEQLTDGEWI